MKELFIYMTYGIFIAMTIFFIVVVHTVLKKTTSHNEILKNGIDTTATITNIQQEAGGTGGYVYLVLSVSFIDYNGNHKNIKINTRVAIIDIEKYKKGSTINIKYLKNDSQRAILTPSSI